MNLYFLLRSRPVLDVVEAMPRPRVSGQRVGLPSDSVSEPKT